jgi:hypothetical protein
MAPSRAPAPACRRPVFAAWVVAPLALGLALVTGCQSNPAPPPMASTSTAPSLSPTPTPAAPTMPPEAKGTSKAAAKAFVRHWIDVLNYAGATGDVAELEQLSLSSCESCSGIVKRIVDTYSDGGRIDGAGWSVLVIEAVPGQARRRPVLQVGVRLSPQTVWAGEGQERHHYRGGKQPMLFRLARKSGWRVRQLEKVE